MPIPRQRKRCCDASFLRRLDQFFPHRDVACSWSGRQIRAQSSRAACASPSRENDPSRRCSLVAHRSLNVVVATYVQSIKTRINPAIGSRHSRLCRCIVFMRCGTPDPCVRRGRGLDQMYASTGTDDDVTGFQTTHTKRSKRPWMPRTNSERNRDPFLRPDGARDAVRAWDGFAGTRHGHGMTRRSRRWRSAAHFMSQPLITTAITWKLAEDWLCERFSAKDRSVH